MACGMEQAGPRVGNMGSDRRKSEAVHKGNSLVSAALDGKGDNAAGAVGQIFLGELVVLVALEVGIVDPRDLVLRFQELSYRKAVLAVALHPDVQRLEAVIQVKSVLRRLDRAEIAHELAGRLGDIAELSELLGIDQAVIALVGSGHAGELVRVSHPVKIAAVDDSAANADRVAVHILCRRVGDDISAPLDRAAVDRGGEGVVHDERNAVGMSQTRKLLDIEHADGGIGDGLAEHRPCVLAELLCELLLRKILIDESYVDAHLLHRNAEQVICTAVDRGRGDNVAAGLADIEQSEEVSRLTAGGQHSGDSALESGDLSRGHIVCGILQTGIKIAARLKVKELAHVVARGVLPCGALVDGKLARFAVSGLIARMQTFGFVVHV